MEPAIKHNYTALYLIYAASIIIFMLSATGLIYYSLGYRYDFDKGQIFQTGILRLYPIKPEYSISIDDQPIASNKIKRTTEITNLLPKDHTVKISAPNYQDWHKIVSINSETVTNESNILLLPDLPKTNDQLVFNQSSYNSDNRLLAYNANSTLQISDLNFNDNPKTFPHATITANTELKWIGPELLTVLNSNPAESNLSIINVVNDNQTELHLPYQIQAHQIIGLDPTQSNLLNILHDEQIIIYDLNNKNPETILFTSVKHPQINHNQLYFQKDNSLFIYNYILKNQQEFPIGQFDIYHLTAFPEFIIFSNNHTNQLYNLNQNQTIFDFSGEIEQISSNQELNLLIKTKTELIVIDFFHQPISYQTILRLTNPINQAIWHDNHNIFYINNQQIKRIDIDGANQQTIIEFNTPPNQIINGENTINAVLDSNGQQLIQTIYLTHESN